MGLRLLLIDDEVDLLESLKEILADDFSEVVACSAPQTAFEECMKTPFDLIISDHNMAEVNGLELLKILRSEGVMTPFIMLTGCASKDIAISALRLGISDLLEKPIDMQDLKMSIARCLELEKNRTFFYRAQDPDHPESLQARKHFSGRLGNLLASIKIQKVS